MFVLALGFGLAPVLASIPTVSLAPPLVLTPAVSFVDIVGPILIPNTALLFHLSVSAFMFIRVLIFIHVLTSVSAVSLMILITLILVFGLVFFYVNFPSFSRAAAGTVVATVPMQSAQSAGRLCAFARARIWLPSANLVLALAPGFTIAEALGFGPLALTITLAHGGNRAVALIFITAFFRFLIV